MIVFEIWRNGTRLCRAGIGELGLLVADVRSWRVRRRAEPDPGGEPTPPPSSSPSSPTPPDEFREGVRLYVGALRDRDPAADRTTHLTWLSESLELGDEITIRLVESTETDPPARTSKLTSNRRLLREYIQSASTATSDHADRAPDHPAPDSEAY